MEHFTKLYPWNPNMNYEHHYPHANRFLPTRGHASTSHYRGYLDGLAVDDVIFSPHGDQGDIVPFHDIFWYSSWIMARIATKYCHLPKRVMRQYMRMHNIQRPSMDVTPLDPPEIAHTFIDFMIHFIPYVDRGSVAKDALWAREKYIS